MKEEIKVIGYGSLHDKDYGTIKINDTDQVLSSVKYDPELDQYCVDNQWEIPFHKKTEIQETITKFDDLIDDIKNVKAKFIEKQMYEPAAAMRDIERDIISNKNSFIKLIKEK